jgi:hypothetical protein
MDGTTYPVDAFAGSIRILVPRDDISRKADCPSHCSWLTGAGDEGFTVGVGGDETVGGVVAG